MSSEDSGDQPQIPQPSDSSFEKTDLIEVPIDLSKLRTSEELELIHLTLEKPHVDPNSGRTFCILKDERGKKYQMVFESFEGPHLTFIGLGCGEEAVQPTIYQVFVAAMQACGMKMESARIEAKIGDMTFATVYWRDDVGRSQVSETTAPDAIILAAITKASLWIVPQALTAFQEVGNNFAYSDMRFEY